MNSRLLLVFSIQHLAVSLLSAATVTGNLTDISLEPLNTKVVFTPTNRVLVSGSALSAGPARIIDTTAGQFSIVLDAGDYTVSLPLVPARLPFGISVPDSAATLDITALLSEPHNYTYPGVIASASAPLALNAGRFPASAAFALTNTWQANSEPLLVFLLGDSLIGNKEADLRTLFRQRFGDLGRGFASSIAHTFSGGASMVTDDFATFVNGIYDVVPAGGTVTYDANGAGTGILADTIKVIYFTQAGGGTFSVQVSANGGGYTTPLPAVSSDSGGTLHLAVATIDLTTSAAALYKARVSGSAGTTRIAGIIFAHHIGRGTVVCSLAQGGRGWMDFAQCSPDILADLGSLLHPRLIFVEETSDAAAWSQAPSVINGILLGCRTNCDTVVLSPNPFILPEQEAQNLEQIAVMRSIALSNHWIYFDQHGLFGNATNMAEAGMLDPTGADVHPRQPARLFALAQMFEATGLSGSKWAELRNNPLLSASGVGNDSNPGFYQLSPGRSCEWWLAHPAGLSSTLYFGDWGGAYGLFGSIEGGLQVTPSALALFGRPGVNILTVNPVSGGAALFNAAFTNNVPVHCPSGFAINTVTWTSGAGSPEGVVTAPVGSLYSRTDGSTGSALYVKETGTGNTGWVAK